MHTSLEALGNAICYGCIHVNSPSEMASMLFGNLVPQLLLWPIHFRLSFMCHFSSPCCTFKSEEHFHATLRKAFFAQFLVCDNIQDILVRAPKQPRRSLMSIFPIVLKYLTSTAFVPHRNSGGAIFVAVTVITWEY